MRAVLAGLVVAVAMVVGAAIHARVTTPPPPNPARPVEVRPELGHAGDVPIVVDGERWGACDFDLEWRQRTLVITTAACTKEDADG